MQFPFPVNSLRLGRLYSRMSRHICSDGALRNPWSSS
jgi:hypothetical protein